LPQSLLQVFRWALLGSGLGTGLVEIVGNFHRNGQSILLLVEGLFLLGLWSISIWKLSSRLRVELKTGEKVWLAVEVVAALLVSVDMIYVTAGQLPLSTSRKNRFRNWVCLELVLIGLAVWGATTREFVVSESLVQVPYGLAMILTTLQVVLWSSFAYLAGHLIAELEEQRRELAWTNGELVATQALLSDAVRESERLRIARELHDLIGHHLVSLTMNLEIAQHKANVEARSPIERAQLVARLLLTETREVVSSMREEQPLDLQTSLETLVAGNPGPPVSLAISLHRPADTRQAQILFRSCEEALTNVHRHARNANVRIVISEVQSRINLVIQDDGKGATNIAIGNGLRGMQERFLDAGGGLGWDSSPGKGFTLMGWLPR
jgi:signal transduction histidine kinase